MIYTLRIPKWIKVDSLANRKSRTKQEKEKINDPGLFTNDMIFYAYLHINRQIKCKSATKNSFVNVKSSPKSHHKKVWLYKYATGHQYSRH